MARLKSIYVMRRHEWRGLNDRREWRVWMLYGYDGIGANGECTRAERILIEDDGIKLALHRAVILHVILRFLHTLDCSAFTLGGVDIVVDYEAVSLVFFCHASMVHIREYQEDRADE
jgi:hypothetical protein